MTELQRTIVNDLLFIEKDMGCPTFTFNGQKYPFIPSISEFRRDLESGGFSVNKLLSSTVRILNKDGSKQFITLPTAQQKIVYNIDGLTYRIETLKVDPTRSHFRLIAVCDARGI
jgi:hypothetical protein